MSNVPVALTFSDVSFSYPHLRVLDDVSFHFHSGEFIALVGPNGSGKTTLLKLILGLEEPQRGVVELLGVAPKRSRDRIGYVSQHADYDPTFPISVLEVVKMGALTKRTSPFRSNSDDAALNVLHQVELQDLATRPYNALSGGQRRRVLVARALIGEPKMLILDEPTANMDKESEKRLFSTLAKLKGETTILIVTHDMRSVSSLTDRVFCIDAHKMGKEGRTVVQHTLETIQGYEEKRIRHDIEIPADFCHYPQEGQDV